MSMPLEPGKTVEEANKKILSIVAPGIDHDTVMNMYKDWAASYDNDMNLGGYNSHKIGVQALKHYYGGKKDIRILDCAAGTGFVGQELTALGFTNVDALDASEEMLEQARSKGVYKNLYHDYMGPDRLNIPENSYDVITSVGCFCQGHVKDDCFPELIRVVKPGGHIFISMRERFLETVPAYKGILEPAMQRLQDDGYWQIISRTVVPNYHGSDNGVVFVFKIPENKKV